MSTTKVKIPELVTDFWKLAEKLGMNPADLMWDLEKVYGKRWIRGEVESFSVTTLGVQDDGEVVPPTGYELVAGCEDVYVGAETASSAFVIRPSWHAETGLFSIEATPSGGTGDFQALAPDEALKLAADIKAVTEGIRPVNIAAAETAAVI